MRGLLLFTAIVLAATVSVAHSINLLDNIVHGTLYNYGLQFSYDWATPYWSILQAIQAFLTLTAASTLVSTVYVYKRYIHAKPERKETKEIEVASEKPTAAPSVAAEPQMPTPSGLTRCTNCGRVFTQPLRMLDFHSDRPRIVNICPFCNEVISPAPRQEELERSKKVAQKSKKNNYQAKGVRELQEARQAQKREETEETVATTT